MEQNITRLIQPTQKAARLISGVSPPLKAGRGGRHDEKETKSYGNINISCFACSVFNSM